MAALTENKNRDHLLFEPDAMLQQFKVKAAAKIYRGAALTMTSTGYVKPLTVGDTFVGFAYEEANNSEGGDGDTAIFGADGTTKTKVGAVRVLVDGIIRVPISGAAVGDIGKLVFATTDNDFTYAADPNNPVHGVAVGVVVGFISTGEVWIRIGLLNLMGGGYPKRIPLIHNADNKTLGLGDAGQIFSNLGATGTMTYSLPASPPAGLVFHFVCLQDTKELRVDPGATDAIYINGALQADGKYVSFDDAAEHLSLIADQSGNWVAWNSAGTFTVEV
jgi:hypothetical protein